jgi:hypothetical protein
MSYRKISLGVIIMIALGITATAALANLNIEFANVSAILSADQFVVKVPPAITGDNIYDDTRTSELTDFT